MELCRLCLNTNDLNVVLEENLLEKLNSSLGISLSITNKFLTKICEPCSLKIEEIYLYRKKVIESEEKLTNSALTFFFNKKISEPVSNSCFSFNKNTQKIQDEILCSNICNTLPFHTKYEKHYISTTTQTDISLLKEPRVILTNYSDCELKKENVDDINIKEEFDECFNDDKYSSEDEITLNKIVETKENKRIKSKKTGSTRTLPKRQKKTKQLSYIDVEVEFCTDDIKKPVKNDKRWQCLICFKNCTSRLKLITHYKDHELNPQEFLLPKYSNQENKNDSISFMIEGYMLVDSPEYHHTRSYQCLKCLKLFVSEKSMVKHILHHDDSRPYPCNKCGRAYKNTYALIAHGKVHGQEKTLFCKYDQCNFSTFYSGALNAHQKRHESEEPSFKYTCKICQKGFNILTWFEQHQNLHTGAKPYVCDTCGKAFPFSRYLKAHRKLVHPDVLPNVIIHYCPHCSKEFHLKKKLKTHLINFHGAEKESGILCDICGKELSNKQHLILHKRIHTGEKPYACRSCGKAFAKKCNLTLHERVHSGERPHVCSQCGKGFSQRSTLVIHERYHTGIRPYQCEKCEKGFVCKGSLSVHYKTCPFQSEIKYSKLI